MHAAAMWEHLGGSPKYKVWDLCMTLEPLIALQARLDAYGAMLPVQAGAFVMIIDQCLCHSLKQTLACVTAWLVESRIPQAVLLSLLPKHSSCNHTNMSVDSM